MIKRYTLRIKSAEGEPLRHNWGYQLYGVLMKAHKGGSYGDALHAQEATPFSQHIVPAADGRGEWVVNLLGDAAIRQFGGRLDDLKSFRLNQANVAVAVTGREHELAPSAREMRGLAAKTIGDADRFAVSFRTPASFKYGSVYAFFPTVAWIVNSLVAKWNSTWAAADAVDDDSVAALVLGLRLSSYDLNSSYYPIKGANIPSFIGEISLTSKLSAPQMELWKTLLYFGRFSGIGIKCALGMGGVEVAAGGTRAGAKASGASTRA